MLIDAVSDDEALDVLWRREKGLEKDGIGEVDCVVFVVFVVVCRIKMIELLRGFES